jgi:hypothetical protein
MTSKSIAAALTLAIGLAFAVLQAQARPARPARPVCADRPAPFSWQNFLFGPGQPPRPNGCAPAVYHGREFIGQDPDINVRYQLNRDPGIEGYHLNTR